MHRRDTPESFTLDVHAGPRSIVVEEPAGSQKLRLVGAIALERIPVLRVYPTPARHARAAAAPSPAAEDDDALDCCWGIIAGPLLGWYELVRGSI